MGAKHGEKLNAVRYVLPNSYRGASRDLLYPDSHLNLEWLMSSEAYAYQYCKVFVDWGGHLKDPHDFQPLVYLGSLLTLEMFTTNEWIDAWPKGKRPCLSDRDYYLHKVHGHQDPVMVVDRYGIFHILKEGESVEPTDWIVKPMTIEIKEKNHEY